LNLQLDCKLDYSKATLDCQVEIFADTTFIGKSLSRGLAPFSPLSFYQSSPCVFLQAAENIVFSKLFVDTARFLW